MPLVHNIEEVGFRVSDLLPLPQAKRILLADPADYEVRYALNPHMVDEAGQLLKVDRTLARKQWENLHAAFARTGLEVLVLPPLPGHPDLVFCANPALSLPPGFEGQGPALLPSRMASEERVDEVEHLVAFLGGQGVTIAPPLEARVPLEGTGDGLWHPGRRLLWAGVGARSDERAWAEFAERYDVPVILLNLSDPDFYHLDTCLGLLDNERCAWFPGAFDDVGRALIEALIPQRIPVPEDEARKQLACNFVCPDGHTVLLPATCPVTARSLRAWGYVVEELDTSEFLKAGGSVFCMKLQF